MVRGRLKRRRLIYSYRIVGVFSAELSWYTVPLTQAINAAGFSR